MSLAQPQPGFFVGLMYPVYVRGEGVFAARASEVKGALNIQKFFEHRGIAVNSPLGALAHLDSPARTRFAGRRRRKGRAAYEEFFTFVERRRPGYSRTHRCQIRVREAEVVLGEIVRTNLVSAR